MRINRSVAYIVTCLMCLGTLSCTAGKEDTSLRQSVDADSIWVFVHFIVPKVKAPDDYYYYGRVNRSLYNRIVDGQARDGLLVMREVRYWNPKDELKKFEDHADSGTVVMRIQDIVRIDVQKGDPWELERKEATNDGGASVDARSLPEKQAEPGATDNPDGA